MQEFQRANKDEVAARLHEIWADLKRAHGENFPQAEFARRIGADPQKLNNWMQGNHLIGLDAVFSIESVLGYRARWVAFGELPKYRSSDRLEHLAAIIARVPDEKLHLLEGMAAELAAPESAPFPEQPRRRAAVRAR